MLLRKDIKGVIRRRKPKKNRQCNGKKKTDQRTNNDLQNTTEKNRQYNGKKKTDKWTNNDLQNTTEKDRQYNGQKKRDKRTNNDLQNITQKAKDRATLTPLKTGMNLNAASVAMGIFLIHSNGLHIIHI